MTKFSLLMCVYEKENPSYLSQCIDSITTQTILPNEWIIVKDGPLTEELESVLGNIQFPNELIIITLPVNVTQGPARAAGVEAAKYQWIAIIDSDDICQPDRFEKQLLMIEKEPRLGLIGGQIAEFDNDPDRTATTRYVPTNHDDILNFAKKRNPFNQMTVMFKRDLALKAGNYRYFPWFEDYDLWSRMIKNGVTCANHPGVLVKARVGSGMYSRRRGKSYIRSEWRMQRQLRKLGMTNVFRFSVNTVARIPVRLLPGNMLAKVYKRFLR